MATIVSTLAFNQNDIDLSRVLLGAYFWELKEDEKISILDRTYTDLYEVQWQAGGQNYSSIFGGNGIAVDEAGIVTAGRVKGYVESYWDGAQWVPYFGIQDINVSAAAMYDAATTASTEDDYAIINGALSGADTFFLSDERDIAKGLGGKDTMYGNGGNDTLNGGARRDKVFGGAENDTVAGGSGRDQLFGNGGNDILKGGTGNDLLKGGSGDDRFVFKTGWDVDTITDFGERGDDVLDLSQLNSVRNWRDLTNNHLSQDGDDVVIDGRNGDVVVLEGVNINDLDKGDFIF